KSGSCPPRSWRWSGACAACFTRWTPERRSSFSSTRSDRPSRTSSSCARYPRRRRATEGLAVAGWGDDPVMAELQQAIADGWQPVGVKDERDSTGTSFDVVTVEKDGDRREFR